MMHYKDIVVSICDSNKKALREYDSQRLENGRETKVHIPFETEYQILVKNNQTKNIRLDIDIDGANVTNDGLIVRPWTTAFIERFLNSENKFKFVPLSNEGVADPTSKENGIITVKAHFEKQVAPKPLPTPTYGGYTITTTPLVGGVFPHGGWNEPLVKYCMSPGVNVREMDYSMTSINYCASLDSSSSASAGGSTSSCSSSVNQPGATVEGSKSDQTFSEMLWEGDDPLVQFLTFKFKMLGMDNKQSKEWQEYMRLKQKFNAA